MLRAGWTLTRDVSNRAIDALPDQREYLSLGQNLLRGDGLRFVDRRFGDWVYAYRTPGYPLLIAACGGNVRWLRLAQALIDTSTVLAVYLLARRLLPTVSVTPGAPLLAAALVALNPFLIYFSGLILSETLFLALLLWGMLLLTGGEGAGRWLGGGVLLAFSILVRPSAIGLPVLLGIAAAFLNRGARSAYQTRWTLPVGATMLLLTVAILAPWGWRNSRPNVLGRWIWTTTNGGITAYDGFNPDATGGSDQSFLRRMPQLREMGEVARSEYLAEQAQRYVIEHPARSLELAMRKIGRTWSPAPLSEQFSSSRYQWIALLYAIPLDLLALAGLIRGRIPKAAKVYLLLPAIYFTAVHAVSVGSLRYRLPAEPPMAVLAAGILHRGGSAPRRGSHSGN